MALPDFLSPAAVLTDVAQALPADVRPNVIIIGSLAAGYHFFAEDEQRAIRTKDVDCLFSPHSMAVVAAAEVADQLLQADWRPREDAKWGKPGKEGDGVDDLPMVRLQPPGASAGSWFLELLSAPPQYEADGAGKKLRRVKTSIGDFAICSFDYLALVECQPLLTATGVHVARPEMMALANLLHHPVIAEALISGTSIKRSNKDLGRVVALAYLTIERDNRLGTDEISLWGQRMAQALREKFGDHAPALAKRAGDGLRAMLASRADLERALDTARDGLLSSFTVTPDAFRAIGERFVVEVLEDLEERFQ